MTKKSNNKVVFTMMGLSMVMVFCMLAFTMCGGSNTKAEEETQQANDEEFYANQPVESGLYDADYYDITGKNARKGKFDGRIYFGLTPKTSAINVFENGNRTKIDYMVLLKQPFEKNDSGVFCAIDMKDNPVTVTPDSVYRLQFIHFSDTVQIDFSSKPRHTANGLEIIEKIKERRDKK